MLKRISLFKRVKERTPEGERTLAEIIDLIRTDQTLIDTTNAICEKHREGILEGFKTVDKGEYQKDKADQLPAICPAGLIYSRAGEIDQLEIDPAGILCLDIDENTPEDLRAFWNKVPSMQYAAAAARSVSGSLNGSFALFLNIEFPTRREDIPPQLIDQQEINTSDSWSKILNKINEAYHEAFTAMLKDQAGIIAGKAGQNLKNLRYLAADPEAYHNPNAKTYSLENLTDYLDLIRNREDKLRSWTGEALNIETTDWIEFGEAFAAAKGYQLQDGQKHEFLTRFSIACNLLGVDIAQVYGYATAKGINVRTNCISYPYRTYKENLGRWKYKLQKKADRQVIEGKKGQKLADLIDAQDIIEKKVIAPTGSGKTYLIHTLPGKKVIVCPTLGLVDNVCADYNAAPFTGSTRDKESIKQADFIAVTYASFRKLTAYLAETKDQYHCIVDESQAFSVSASPAFQLKQLHEVLQEAQGYKDLTLLTGTDVYNHDPRLRNIPRISFYIPQSEKALQLVDAIDVLKETAEQIKNSIAAGRFPLVLFNNTSDDGKLGTLKSLLADQAGIKYLNSHTKQDPDWKKITSEGIIDPEIKGIVTTSVLKEGNNILNKYHFDIIVVGHFHSTEIVQFSSRPRKPKSVSVSIIRSENRTRSERIFCPEQFAYQLEDDAQSVCNDLNTKAACANSDTSLTYLEVKARQAIKQNPIRYDEEQNLFLIDYLHLSNITFTQERIAENRNDQLLIRNLNKYGIVYRDQVASCAEQTTEEKANAAKIREQKKEKELQEYNATLDQLSHRSDAYEFASDQITGNKDLTKIQKAVYSRYKKLYELTLNHAGTINRLKDIGPKKAKFIQLIERLRIALLRSNKAYLADGNKFAMILQAVENEFKEGDLLTSDQIKDKLTRILTLDRSLDIEQDQRSDKALKILRLFFEVDRKDQRDQAGKKVNKYRICPLTFEDILNNNSKIRVQTGPETVPQLL
jgi:hypothetical protein